MPLFTVREGQRHAAARGRVLVVGSGGFAQEMVGYLQQELCGSAPQPQLAGLVCDHAPQKLRQLLGTPYLGRLSDFERRGDELFVVAVGRPAHRERICAQLAEYGAVEAAYVHPTAWVANSARVGAGAVIGPQAVVNAAAALEESCVVNVFASVGHGARVGRCSVLSPYAALNGDSSVGAGCFLGTRATVFPRVTLGDCCIVDSHSFVRQSVGSRKMVSVRGQYVVVDNRLENP